MCADDNHPKRPRDPHHLTCHRSAGRERGDRLADQWICRFSAFGVLRDARLEEKSFVSTLLLMPIVAMFAGDR